MLTPDDPRHGTLAGYVAGCNGRNNGCKPCADAKYRYEKLRSLELGHGQQRMMDSTGTVRRIQALLAIGWTYKHIGELAGSYTLHWASQIARSPRTNSHTREAVARVYKELSMKVGPSTLGAQRAKAKGWVPPLAWDDETIDDPNAEPYKVPKTLKQRENHNGRERQRIDPVVIERALLGQKVKANALERVEIIRRWTAKGESVHSICQIQGWQESHARIGKAA
jgi:hypothetical protein